MLKKIIKDLVFTVNRNPVSSFIYEREISKRSKLPITDIYSLSKHIQVFSPFTKEINPANDWYGHAKNFKKYLSLPQNYQFKFIIEHGTYLNDKVAEVELEPNLPTFLTYSNFRVNVLKKYRDHAFSVGPFIHYASTLYSKEKINQEKKRLGKNILVFPAHSFSYIIHEYDKSWFINNIKNLTGDFKTVRICLFWADIQLGLHKYYERLGYECVTAGHILDPNFLPRLKTLIEISDLTISNDAGTHVSYCTYLNKPHIIFHKVPKVKGNKKWTKTSFDIWTAEPYKEILKEFSKISHRVTSIQRRVVDKYYGSKNNIKTPSELRKIVSFTEKIYQETKR